jgi:hypothetical protein
MTSQIKVDAIVPNQAASVTISPVALSGGTITGSTITGGSISDITDITVADGGTGASTAAGARTNLELGTMATQAASAVAITGGTVTGITDITVADGGTGASDAATARTNLGAVGLTGNETVAGVKTLSSNPVVSGGGIQFPGTAVPSADVNCLDDYEEGTWTPSVGGTATYTTQSGTYTKIGRLVYVRLYLVINTIGTGSTSQISGLPFQATALGGGGSPGLVVSQFASSATNVTSLWGQFSTSSTSVSIQGLTAAAATSGGVAFFGNGTVLQASGCYETT